MPDAPQDDQSTLRGKLSSWAKGPAGYPVAALIGFLEGSFVIVPMEPVFIPLMVLKRKQALLIALLLLFGNVLGGLLMYWLGAVLADGMIQPIVNMFDANQSYEQTIKELKENGFTTLFMIGVTPFPFQVGVVAAGAAGFSVILFTIAVTFSRAIRFVLIAIFVMIIGSRAEDLLRKYELELMIGGVLLFIGSAIYLFFF